jgi:Fe-S cluster assembly protein SufD
MNNVKYLNYINYLNEAFNSLLPKLNEFNNEFLLNVKKDAIRNFNKFYFPNIKVEDWRYLPIDTLLQNKYEPLQILKLNDYSYNTDFHPTGSKIVLKNGKIVEQEIKNKRIKINSFVEAITSDYKVLEANYTKYSTIDSGFAALNVAFALNGIYINIPDKTILEENINLVFLSGDTEHNLYLPIRNFIHVGDNCEVNIVFLYQGQKGKEYLNSVFNNLIIGKNSFVKIFEIDLETENSHHINKTQIRSNFGSQISHYRFSLDGKILRNDTNVLMDGKEVTANLYGIIIAADKQVYDNHTMIDHALPNCFSNEVYKSVLLNEAKNVFNGKIIVRKDAQKTNAYQQNKNLLLSNNAVVDAKPQLEIFADDVKCTHGATVGQLDKDGLFYLQSRGISKDKATQILVHAYANEIFEEIKDDYLNDYLKNKINQKIQF